MPLNFFNNIRELHLLLSLLLLSSLYPRLRLLDPAESHLLPILET